MKFSAGNIVTCNAFGELLYYKVVSGHYSNVTYTEEYRLKPISINIFTADLVTFPVDCLRLYKPEISNWFGTDSAWIPDDVHWNASPEEKKKVLQDVFKIIGEGLRNKKDQEF